ncbi:hypothetical protein [Rhodovastum atsumiense]|uniref:Uncharacterized protein n=1 Tax=Rhodovastum atsumiense TaxID=504468 RepID=A0A5M6J234_9PROT|nr:hypothetical protein [Rhodovastum atsumiense]KAA5614652.1 hypothetical protein F1189_00555 [Rhodovastum atsumiense]
MSRTDSRSGNDTPSTPATSPASSEMDRAHEAAGDGVLPGSVPAGLTVKELEDRARAPAKDVPATD